MTVSLRTARSTDAGKLGDILTRARAAQKWMPQLHSGAEDIAFCGRMIDRFNVIVAHDGNASVSGFLVLDAPWILSLYIHPDHQRSGIGSTLLDAAKAPTKKLELWTHEANLPAQAFYIKAGFTEAERTDGATTDERLPDIRYVWHIPEKAMT